MAFGLHVFSWREGIPECREFKHPGSLVQCEASARKEQKKSREGELQAGSADPYKGKADARMEPFFHRKQG